MEKKDNQSTQIIRDILSELKEELVEAVWAEFELKVTNTHDTFFSNLLAEFPDLNSSELKICALIRFNMTSKEIAEIMHASPASVDVMRSRLRKKLQMTSDENLLQILMNY